MLVLLWALLSNRNWEIESTFAELENNLLNLLFVPKAVLDPPEQQIFYETISNIFIVWLDTALTVPSILILNFFTPTLEGLNITHAGRWSLRIPVTLNLPFSEHFLKFWPEMTLNKLDESFFAKSAWKHFIWRTKKFFLDLVNPQQGAKNWKSAF